MLYFSLVKQELADELVFEGREVELEQNAYASQLSNT